MTTRQTMILPWMCALALAGLGCTDDVGDTDTCDGDPTGDGDA